MSTTSAERKDYQSWSHQARASARAAPAGPGWASPSATRRWSAASSASNRRSPG